jgi:hypothetical protein
MRRVAELGSLGRIRRIAMNPLTKEQLEKLTPQQQELLAGVEAQRLRKREALLRQTRLYRGFYAIPAFFVLAAFVIMVRDTTKTMLLPFCIIALGGLIHFHAAGVNRRIDALVELLDADLKKCTHRDDDDAA